MKTKNNKKFIGLSLGLGVTVSTAAVIVASCGVSQQALNSLFKADSTIGFANSESGSVNSIVTNSLSNKNGFDAFIGDKLGDVLSVWYENNENQAVRNKYENFVASVDEDWDNRVKEQKKTSGNDYLLELQKNLLDSNGGTEETWKRRQVNEKVITDFTTELFSKLHLNFTNDGGSVVSPSQGDLLKKDNWSKIKFTAGGYKTDDSDSVQNLNETYADIQNAIFNKWVESENPNLVSRVVFTNEQPKNQSLGYVFNENLIGKDNLTSSYAFQVFADNTNDVTSSKGMAAYKEMLSGTGLSKYVASDGSGMIDIPNSLSSDSGGKLLMTASDMFNTYDVAFTAAFVQQYLEMTGASNKDNIGAEITLAGATNGSTDNPFNIMNNFIRQAGKNPDGSNGTTNSEPKTAYTENNTIFTNINPELTSKVSTDKFYKNYADLLNGNTGNKSVIYNVVKPKSTTTTPPGNATDKNNQFILARGNDGVHIMAIDGGEYYLSSSANGTNNKGRNIDKQKEFLKFRALLASSNNIPATTTYTFDLSTQLSNFLSKDRNAMLYAVLKDALDKKNSFVTNQTTSSTTNTTNFFDLKANEKFKEAFKKLSDKVDAYAQAYIAYQKASQFEANVNGMISKLNSWAKGLSDHEMNLTPYKIGISAKLPYVRETDGDYYGLNQYYLSLYGLQTNGGTTTDTNGTVASKGKSRQAIHNELQSKLSDLNKKTEDMVKGFDLEIASPIQYSQNLFVRSKSSDTEFDLALNVAIQNNITNSWVTNGIKKDYFKASKKFGEIFDWNTGDVKDSYLGINNGVMTDVIKTYYKGVQWNGTDRYSYGSFSDQNGLDTLIKYYWDTQNIKENPNSDAAISYYSYLYTFEWLTRDNLKNFKTILSSQITQGSNALVSWVVPANPNTLDKNGTATPPSTAADPISTFIANPNYLQGSTTNWFNATFKNGSNGSTNNTVPAPDLFNTASNPYMYTNTRIDTTQSGGSTSTTTNQKLKLYGFNGISTDSSMSGLDANVSDAIFGNYSRSGTEGALQAYGTRADLQNYVEKVTSVLELDELVTVLENRGRLDLSRYHQKIDGKDVLNFKEKKELVLSTVKDTSKAPDSLFERFTGYIGTKKAKAPLSSQQDKRKEAYQSSDPVVEGGNSKLTRMATYISQINYQDVKALGSDLGWLRDDAAGDKFRLGLDLSTLLATVALQASDATTQSLALTDLVNSNIIKEVNERIKIGDKRLYDALTNIWITKEN